MSNAEEIRKYYKQLLIDGKPHSREELFSFVKQHDEGNKYTKAMLAGALFSLVDKEKEYIRVERATYQFIDWQKQDIFSQYISIFENMLTDIDKVSISPVEFLVQLNEKDKGRIILIESCIESVKNTIMELRGD